MRYRNLSLALALATSGLFAAGAKSYQVTGPVTDIQGDVVTIQKGPKDLWQINLPKGTKGCEGLKKGDKVTLYYTMTATEVEIKGAKKAEAPKAEAKPAAKPAAKKKAA